jgi:hypothetical protein
MTGHNKTTCNKTNTQTNTQVNTQVNTQTNTTQLTRDTIVSESKKEEIYNYSNFICKILNYELCENKTFISEIHKKYMRYYKRDVKNITSLRIIIQSKCSNCSHCKYKQKTRKLYIILPKKHVQIAYEMLRMTQDCYKLNCVTENNHPITYYITNCTIYK